MCCVSAMPDCVDTNTPTRKRPLSGSGCSSNRTKKPALGSYSDPHPGTDLSGPSKESIRKEVRELRHCYELLCAERGAASSDAEPFQQLLLACQGVYNLHELCGTLRPAVYRPATSLPYPRVRWAWDNFSCLATERGVGPVLEIDLPLMSCRKQRL